MKNQLENQDPKYESGGNGQGYGGKIMTFYAGASDVQYNLSSFLGGGSSYSLAPDLPQGLSLDATTSRVSGTPQGPSESYFVYSASVHKADGQTFSINVLIGVGHVYFVSPEIEGMGLGDADPADHLCADINGVCSFRAALDQAAANPVKTRIVLPNKKYLLGSVGGLDIPSNIELVGSGVGGVGVTELSGEDAVRVLNLTGTDVTLKKLSVTHGKVTGSEAGAGIKFDNNNGWLEMRNVELSYNNVETNMYGGGGLFFSGRNFLLSQGHVHHNSEVAGSSFDGGGGGLYLRTGDDILIENSLIEDNSAKAMGGGIVISLASAVRLDHVVLARNTAGFYGGGLHSYNGSHLDLNSSVFMDNVSQYSEGGAISWTPRNLGTLLIVDSTFARNRAVQGGAISLGPWLCSSLVESVNIRNSTFADNTATTSGGGGAFRARQSCSMELINTIVGSNGEQSCNLEGSIPALLPMKSGGNNIDAGNSCGLSGPNDLTNTDPLLAPLTAVGSTFVYPLQSGSPAIDSANPRYCQATDQTGTSRSLGSQCDRGAYEFR